jgi:hypothetical protein
MVELALMIAKRIIYLNCAVSGIPFIYRAVRVSPAPSLTAAATYRRFCSYFLGLRECGKAIRRRLPFAPLVSLGVILRRHNARFIFMAPDKPLTYPRVPRIKKFGLAN